ncbi:MAG: ATP-grasp domain-containing protein [Myxococcota bacterium]
MPDVDILFARPSAPQAQVDSLDLEAHAADEFELTFAWTAMEAIVDDAEEALRHIDEDPGRTWLYRGWMLREDEYASLTEAIEQRGETLLVSPEEYALTLYFPNYVDLIAAHTAKSVSTGNDLDEAWEAAQTVPGPPWFVKDHVKSAKEDWPGACVVSSAEDFRATCEALRSARGDRFERGFVIREFLPLASLPIRDESGRPLFDEHRLVYWDGELVAHAPYHDYESPPPPLERFAFLAEIDSLFFTADIARLTDGTWRVLELNDGGVSTLPPLMDPRDLYRHIADWNRP